MKYILFVVIQFFMINSYCQITHLAYKESILAQQEIDEKQQYLTTLFEYYLVDNYDSLVYQRIQSFAEDQDDVNIKYQAALISIIKQAKNGAFSTAREQINELKQRFDDRDPNSQALFWRAHHYLQAKTSNKDSSILYLKKSLSYQNEIEDLSYVSAALSLITTQIKRGQLDEGMKLTKHIQNKTAKIVEKDSSFLTLSKFAETMYLEGVIEFYKGKYRAAQQLLLSALAIEEAIENDRFISTTHGLLAACYGSLKQFDLALQLHQKEIQRIKQKRVPKEYLGISFENLANTYLEMQRYDEAFQHYDSAILYSPNQVRTAHIYNNMGIAHFRKGNYQQATAYYQKAFDLRGGLENTNKRDLGSSLINLGGAYTEAGRYKIAQDYLLKGLEISKETEMLQQQRSAYDLLAELYEKTDNYKDANNYLKQGNIVKDSLYQREIQESITEMQTKYETEKKEAEILRQESRIEILEKDRALAQSRSIILFGGIILLVAIGILSYNRQQTQKALIKAELGLSQSREEVLKKDVEYKNQELVNFAVQITQKNEFIGSLNEEVSAQKKSGADLQKIEALIKANASITRDREAFENHVQNLYEGFYSRLDQTYPELTANDRKLAALIRMELSSKEIATVLNISPKSVDQSRYRLRQKMNLDAKANLAEKLQSV